MAYSLGDCNQLIKDSFPDRRLRITIGRSVRFFIIGILIALVVSILGMIIFVNMINPMKFLAIIVLAGAFLAAYLIMNMKKLRYLYSIKDKKVLPILVPLEQVYSAKSMRGSVNTKVAYQWPVGSQKIVYAEFPGATGPLIIETSENDRQYALGLAVDKNDKGKFIPYLMDKRVTRCMLSKEERIAILRTIRKINKATIQQE